MTDVSMDSRKGLLIVDRTSDKDIKFRDLYVLIDDLPEKNVVYGKALEIPLSPGEHRIKVTNRIKHDQATFQLNAGETVRFEAINVYTKGLMNAFAMVLGAAMYKPVLRRR